MYNLEVEELKKNFSNLNLYDLIEVSKFCKKILNLNLVISENLEVHISAFSISSVYENTLKKYIYIVDITIIENKEIEYSLDLENFMSNTFNLKLNY